VYRSVRTLTVAATCTHRLHLSWGIMNNHHIEDWSRYLIVSDHLLRQATDAFNMKDYQKADDLIAELLHNGRMARVWIMTKGETNGQG